MIRHIIAGMLLQASLYAVIPLPTVCSGTNAYTATIPKGDAALECVLLARDIARVRNDVDAVSIAALGDGLYRLTLLNKMGHRVEKTKDAIKQRLTQYNRALRQKGLAKDDETVLNGVSSDGTKRYLCRYDGSNGVRCVVTKIESQHTHSVSVPHEESLAQTAPVKTCVLMRTKPSLESEAVACIQGDKQIKVLSEKVNGFRLIRANAQEGWMKDVFIIGGGK